MDALAKHLGVGESKVIDWMGGIATPPHEVLEKAVAPFLKKSK